MLGKDVRFRREKKEGHAYEYFEPAMLCDHLEADACVLVELSMTMMTPNYIDLPNVSHTGPWDQTVRQEGH